MADVKLTKNELRSQQDRLSQLQKYLPTLQLKKAMLQFEVYEARVEIESLKTVFEKRYDIVCESSALLSEKTAFHPEILTKIAQVKKRYENIAGVEVPYFESVIFDDFPYSLYETPPWVDSLLEELHDLLEAKARIQVAEEKKAALEKELREVSIRVNLFEKILIPRAQKNIRKIKVFLGDQQLSAVSQAKVAKSKIEQHKETHRTKAHAI